LLRKCIIPLAVNEGIRPITDRKHGRFNAVPRASRPASLNAGKLHHPGATTGQGVIEAEAGSA
jgi:hypothetical protein